jgi:ornithine carbamoyltransferase
VWNRFTERSRRLVFFAQEEATLLGKNYVNTEHLLLGMIRDDTTVAMRILQRVGVTGPQIRSHIERLVLTTDDTDGTEPQLSPRAKRVIDLAYEEARQISDEYIGTEHLLLGLIRESDGLAGRVLAELGVELDRIRREVLALQDNDSGAAQPSPQPIGTSASVAAPPPVQPPQSLRMLVQRDAADWRGRSLVSLFDISEEQIVAVLELAANMKTRQESNRKYRFSYSKTLALLFEKPSLRTRVSFEAGMAQLGGHAIYLAPSDVGLGVRESVADVAGGLSRWVDVIAAGTFKHETIEELARNATVPVINALSDREHPIQAFADLLTILEAKRSFGSHLKLAYVGDGNNVLHALLLACAKVGVNLTAACPMGYRPSLAYVAEAQRIGSGPNGTGARIEILTDPVTAVRDADVVYTDVWTSMGQEDEKAQRLEVFAPYQVNAALLFHAKADVLVLHCLPAHRGEEISAEVLDAYGTVIQDQAENRLHTQKALVALMLGL